MAVIGLGCMRLSTARDRNTARAIAVIHAALDTGVTLLDTADAYCHDDSETGHNERLVAEALRQWSGDRSRIEVATKGGLRRPGGKWVNDGRAKHLRAACDASRRALGVETIDLYQLHAVDPATPIETSVRALASLKQEGAVRSIGLCNVTVGQLEAARAIAEIAAVQVSLSVFDNDSLRNGVAEYARDHGMRLVAYRPLGGERHKQMGRDPTISQIAAGHDVTPETVALAWLLSFGEGVVPIPGATRVETARALAQAVGFILTDDEREQLDQRFSGRLLRVPRNLRRPPDDGDGDVVMVMGMPGAGKSSLTREFVAAGYERLNRDERGGTLSELLPELDHALAGGRRRWVLDNTYATRASRNDVIECSWNRQVPVRCVHLTTTVADAQINAITRLVEVHGRLPMPDELRERGRKDPRYFGPDAQFRYERSVELPTMDEGFTAIEERAFVRRDSTALDRKAICFDFDDLVMRQADGSVVHKAEDVRLVEGRREKLSRRVDEGWLLFAQAWRPHDRGVDSPIADIDMESCFARTQELLGVEINLACCVHGAGPPICWCRKPLPGFIIEFATRHHVAYGHSIVVGAAAADRTMASKLGMSFHNTRDFFDNA